MAKRKGYPNEHKGVCTPLKPCPYCKGTAYLQSVLEADQLTEFLRLVQGGEPVRRQKREKGESPKPVKAKAASPQGEGLKELGLTPAAAKALRKLGITTTKALVAKTREELYEAGIDGRTLNGVEARLKTAGASLKK